MKRLAAFLAAVTLLFSSAYAATTSTRPASSEYTRVVTGEHKDLMQFMENYMYALTLYNSNYKNSDYNIYSTINGSKSAVSTDKYTGREVRTILFDGGNIRLDTETFGVHSVTTTIYKYEDGIPRMADVYTLYSVIYALENSSIKYASGMNYSASDLKTLKSLGIFADIYEDVTAIMDKCTDKVNVNYARQNGMRYVYSSDNYDYYIEYLSGLPMIDNKGKETGETYDTLALYAVIK